MPRRLPTLSKSRFTAGLQCYRRLWWQTDEPRAPELVPDADLQAIFRRGELVGRLARDYIPGGVLIEFDGRQKTRATEATKAAIASGASVIYEASMVHDRVFAAIDVLSREGADRWTLTEVKSTTKVKDEHIADTAVQTWVARSAGLNVERVELMHLNTTCRYPDLSDLFVRHDITQEVEAYLPSVPAAVAAQLKMLAGSLPEVPPGPHCKAPYTCPFLGRCTVAAPQGHIDELYRLRAPRAAALADDGIALIKDMAPEDIADRPIWLRQYDAAQTGEMVIAPGLGSAVPAVDGTVGYLDFETISPAVPVWNACGPYGQVPVQFSLHVKDGPSLVHHAFLAEGADDPREALTTALLEAAKDCETLYAYNASFEARCIAGLAAALPTHAKALGELGDRLVDLLPMVRNHVYHPDFRGSFGLKAVLPALVPTLDYADLAISSGMTASNELEQLLLNPPHGAAAETETLREQLLAYCERDTLALVKLHAYLADAS